MSSLFTNYFGVVNAKNFEKFVTSVYGNTYITIGKNIPWPNNDDPPTPTESNQTFYQYWDNITGLKKITAADMQLVIPRVDWDATGQTIYTAYTETLDIFKKTDATQIPYDYKFYVRNNRDQVFKCLANTSGITSATPIRSTIMPEITIGGDLPENSYIETSDGYKWKYMYTIPPGLKEKFLTKQYMPVHYDNAVLSSSVDGRLDIFKVVKKGTGYNGNSTASSLGIASIKGNGLNGKITLGVSSSGTTGAVVSSVKVVNGGSGYTEANVIISDPIKTALSEDAIIQAVIGPPGGHGSDPWRELGASNIMISVDIEGTENDELPMGYLDSHAIRQIGILLDPLTPELTYASDDVYRGTTKFTVTEPNTDYIHGQIVYSGGSLATCTFRGIVEHYDSTNKYVFVTSIYGKPVTYTPLYGVSSDGVNETGATSSILSIEEPRVKRYSGKLLYIEDTSQLNRTPDQITRFKFTLRF